MPLLTCSDALPSRPRRVIVNGTSGSGKTMAARALAGIAGIPHHELDALRHGEGWVPRPSFEADVAAFAATGEWVTEWQYGVVRPLLLDRADLMLWLDLPVSLVMWQVVARTVRRRVTREVLWNGNRETPLHAMVTDPDHVIRWAWRTRRDAAERTARVVGQRPELPVVRIRSRRELSTWLSGPLRRAC